MSRDGNAVSLNGQPALDAVLDRWPVVCARADERAVAEEESGLPGEALVLVTAGPIWARWSATTGERLETGDLLIVHEPESTTLTATIPEGSALSSSTGWLTDSPLNPRKVLLVQLSRVGSESSRRLSLSPFILRRQSQSTNVENALTSALVEAVRADVPWPVVNSAATAIYLHCVHGHLLSRPREVPILAGLFDAEIGPVVAALLEAPARDWTVESLADVGGMSRSAFARKFRDLMGMAPIDFLVEVRMWQASRQLRQGSPDLKSVARQAGYQSPAAFSVAFKRWSGETPSDYRRGT